MLIRCYKDLLDIVAGLYSNLSINFNYIDLNDSRDIYHDFKKIMNDCDTEEISNKYNT